MAEPKKVYTCDHCGRVVAEIKDGKLVIVQRHEKEQHTTVITLTESPADVKH